MGLYHTCRLCACASIKGRNHCTVISVPCIGFYAQLDEITQTSGGLHSIFEFTFECKKLSRNPAQSSFKGTTHNARNCASALIRDRCFVVNLSPLGACHELVGD